VTPLDQYIQSQVGPTLEPGEQLLHSSTMRRQPGLLLQIFLLGGLLMMLLTKVYLVALTNRRLILIRTKAGFFSGTPQPLNLGVEQYDVRTIKKVSTSGFANNRSMTFHLDTSRLKLRISPWFKAVSGTKDFFEQVPNLINSGQLASAQLPAPAGYAALPQPYAAPAPAPAYGSPPQYAGGHAQGFPPAPHYAAPPPLVPGARVMVLGQDGQRYPGTLVQLHGEHCLCAMHSGQFWYPSSHVTPSA
jgi:hypothetical protein